MNTHGSHLPSEPYERLQVRLGNPISPAEPVGHQIASFNPAADGAGVDLESGGHLFDGQRGREVASRVWSRRCGVVGVLIRHRPIPSFWGWELGRLVRRRVMRRSNPLARRLAGQETDKVENCRCRAVSIAKWGTRMFHAREMGWRT